MRSRSNQNPESAPERPIETLGQVLPELIERTTGGSMDPDNEGALLLLRPEHGDAVRERAVHRITGWVQSISKKLE